MEISIELLNTLLSRAEIAEKKVYTLTNIILTESNADKSSVEKVATLKKVAEQVLELETQQL